MQEAVSLVSRSLRSTWKLVVQRHLPSSWSTTGLSSFKPSNPFRGVRSKSWIASMAVCQYPKPRRADIKDVLHGSTVEDPYRWMEDPDAEETKLFVEAQNSVSRPFVAACSNREDMKKTLTELWDYPKFTCPSKRGSFYFYRHNTGLQNQSVLYMKKTLDSNGEVFLDPNTFSDDGTVALADTSCFSKQGNFYAYAISVSGSDWATLKVRRVEDKTDLSDTVERLRYSSIAWTHDEKGFFYGQYADWEGDANGREAKAVENQKLFYHKLGTSQDQDILIAEFPEHPKWRMGPHTSDCGKYLIVSVSENCKNNQVYYANIPDDIKGPLELNCIYGTFDCQLHYITNEGTSFLFQTNKDRPTYGVIKLDINTPEKWTDVIAADPDRVMESVDCRANDKLVVFYLKDVTSLVEVRDINGKYLQTLPFELGTTAYCTGEKEDTEIFFYFTSFLTPAIIYRCDLSKVPSAALEVYDQVKLGTWSTDDISTKQVFFKSKDGTSVPMFIMRQKDAAMDGSTPCLLYVYGGFNISLAPSFSLFRLMLIRTLGFTVAVANVRGGGEYGERWHNGGRLESKQNTLDDVHAAASYLADQGYTTSKKLVLMGGSNGGMVTTASCNQRPELFGAAIAQVPVTDMFRFHKFTIGHAWCSDYGNPDLSADFAVQKAYSPLHNIPNGINNYPATLVLTADHDDRVVPAHTLKFVAELQHRLGERNSNPLLALVDTKAGHGAGKPTAKVIQELVDIMCFLQRALKLTLTK